MMRRIKDLEFEKLKLPSGISAKTDPPADADWGNTTNTLREVEAVSLYRQHHETPRCGHCQGPLPHNLTSSTLFCLRFLLLQFIG